MSEHQGNIYMTDAKNILSKSTWFFGPTKEEKIALGIDLYCKAANQYKIIKSWDKAGFCYNEAAKLNLELSNSEEFGLAISHITLSSLQFTELQSASSSVIICV